MNTARYLVLFSLVFLIGGGCTISKNSDSTQRDHSLVNDLQEQEIKFIEKEPISETRREPIIDILTLYRGDWFSIEYPGLFTALPEEPRIMNAFGIEHVETDEATFLSPDGDVEFYVYSPQWNGNSDYTNVAENEEVVSKEKKESEDPSKRTTTEWVTVKAKDGSYYRSFVSLRSYGGNTPEQHHVFGIKYTNEKAYETYKGDYTAFKESLRQYTN